MAFIIYLWCNFSLTKAAVLCGILCPPQGSGIYCSTYKELVGSETSKLYVGLFKVSTAKFAFINLLTSNASS